MQTQRIIPFPLPPQVGISCISHLFLTSPYFLTSSDPVQQHYTVKGEQVPILWKLTFHLLFLLGMSSLVSFSGSCSFWKTLCKTSKIMKTWKTTNSSPFFFSGSKYYCQNNSVWCIHTCKVLFFSNLKTFYLFTRLKAIENQKLGSRSALQV